MILPLARLLSSTCSMEKLQRTWCCDALQQQQRFVCLLEHLGSTVLQPRAKWTCTVCVREQGF